MHSEFVFLQTGYYCRVIAATQGKSEHAKFVQVNSLETGDKFAQYVDEAIKGHATQECQEGQPFAAICASTGHFATLSERGQFVVRNRIGDVECRLEIPKGQVISDILGDGAGAMFSPDARLFAFSTCRNIYLWSTSDGQMVLKKGFGDGSLVLGMWFSGDGFLHAAVMGIDKYEGIFIVDIERNTVTAIGPYENDLRQIGAAGDSGNPRTTPMLISELCVSQDGSTIVAYSKAKKALMLFKEKQWETIGSLMPGHLDSLRLSSDGRYLVALLLPQRTGLEEFALSQLGRVFKSLMYCESDRLLWVIDTRSGRANWTIPVKKMEDPWNHLIWCYVGINIIVAPSDREIVVYDLPPKLRFPNYEWLIIVALLCSTAALYPLSRKSRKRGCSLSPP